MLSIIAAIFAFSSPSYAANDLAVVDTAVLLQKSNAGVFAQRHLEKVRKVLQKGFDDLASAYKGREKEESVQRILLQGQNALQRQMGVEQAAVNRILNDAILKASDKWLSKNSRRYSAVIAKGALLANIAKADVTAGVMREMNKIKVKFPDLPKVTIRK